MCTLIVLDRVVPRAPLLVASNRDEYLARPSAPPTRVDPGRPGVPSFVAPQDLEAGGTWMGVNAHGVFVGLTNRRVVEPRADVRSRGLLVQDALACGSAAEIRERLLEDLAGVYNPFHLFCGDGKRSFFAVVTEARAEIRELSPGRHVICNRDPDDPESRKVSRISGRVEALSLEAGPSRLVSGLAELLREHTDDPFESTCVHTEGYGTRSSTLLALGARRWQGWHAEGPPCEAKYRTCTRLLESLR